MGLQETFWRIDYAEPRAATVNWLSREYTVQCCIVEANDTYRSAQLARLLAIATLT